ncbi:MAG TPA: hypothetical protein VF097_10325 [Actinomycetota bacterium]
MSERCPRCGGLNAPDAEWCGQCFTRLGEPEEPAIDPAVDPVEAAAMLGELASPEERTAEPAPGVPSDQAGGEPAGAPPGGPPADEQPAEGEPPLQPGPATEASPFQVREDGLVWVCRLCEAENPLEAHVCARCGTPFGALFEEGREASEIDPGRASALSLIFPGLGHLAAGHRVEGLARILIFVWLIGTIVVIVAARAGRGLGPLLGLVVLYMASAGALYMLSAIDARRATEGDDPIVSSRILLYGISALLLVTIVFLFFSGPTLRG